MLVKDAQRHGLRIKPVVVVECSEWRCTLEPESGDRLALRLGLGYVRGLRALFSLKSLADLYQGEQFESIFGTSSKV